MKPLNTSSLKNGKRSIYQSVESGIIINDKIMNGTVKLDGNIPGLLLCPKQYYVPLSDCIAKQKHCSTESPKTTCQKITRSTYLSSACETNNPDDISNTVHKIDNIKSEPICINNIIEENIQNKIKKPTAKTKTSKSGKDNFLTTNKIYYIPNYFPTPDDVNKEENIQVPSWTYNPIPSFYKIEGTEDLDDRVFHRRHLKYEHEEKRRKRWDMQRIREQRAAQKLRQKHQKSESSQSNKNYFCPELNQLKYIEVTDKLPVIAFGQPIPIFQPSEFSLPTETDSEQTTSTPKKINSKSWKKDEK